MLKRKACRAPVAAMAAATIPPVVVNGLWLALEFIDTEPESSRWPSSPIPIVNLDASHRCTISFTSVYCRSAKRCPVTVSRMFFGLVVWFFSSEDRARGSLEHIYMAHASLRTTHYYLTVAIENGGFFQLWHPPQCPPPDCNLIPSETECRRGFVSKQKLRTQFLVLNLRTRGHNFVHYQLSYGALHRGRSRVGSPGTVKTGMRPPTKGGLAWVISTDCQLFLQVWQLYMYCMLSSCLSTILR